MEGWIKLHRKFNEWEWYNISEMVHLFIHLLINANNKEGEWRGVILRRGQILTGLNSLHQATKISQQTIRTCLKRLEKTQEINIQSTNKYSIITICKYDDYQSEKITTNKQPNKQLTNNQQTTNNKQEYNKEDKENNIYSFDDFWDDYGKKRDSKACREKWSKIKDSEKIKIKDHVKKYVLSTPEVKFRKDPIRYLTHEIWNDEINIFENTERKFINGVTIALPGTTPLHLRPEPKSSRHTSWNDAKQTWDYSPL